MTSPKPRWFAGLLWPNLAVAVVILVLVSSNLISSPRQLLRLSAYMLAYSNLTALLGGLLFAGIAGKLALRRFPAFLLCIFVIVPLGVLLVQSLLFGLGLDVPQRFWLQYFHSLRVCTPLAIVFGLGAFAHMSLRGRVQAMAEKLHEKEVAEARTQKLLAEARLQSLEARIQPHFLFNTLNSISSLIVVNPARAEQMVSRLATLLRASLDNSNQPLIPLRQELALVESYMEIEKARFGDKLRGSVQVPAGLQDTQVPPMSVQALVENAVKHGITPQSGGGEVQVTASAENGNLRIEVRDTGPGFELAAIRAGHGLDNLVGRLDALFGAKARLNVFRREGYSVIEMVLPRG
jgi:signal transduction histidine kinase